MSASEEVRHGCTKLFRLPSWFYSSPSTFSKRICRDLLATTMQISTELHWQSEPRWLQSSTTIFRFRRAHHCSGSNLDLPRFPRLVALNIVTNSNNSPSLSTH